MEQSFLGTGWSFPPEFNVASRGLRLSSDEQDIQESIRIILTTIPGERIMRLDFGCDLEADLFESMGSTEINRVKNKIKEALLRHEPRIDVEKVELHLERGLEGILEIFLEYTVIITNTRTNMVFPYYKKEATDI